MKKKYIVIISALSICTLFNCKRSNDGFIILFTNDPHGEINAKLNYATVSKMKKDLEKEGKNVLLFDAGDHISGGFYTAYDNGISMVNFMNLARYDASTLGNHEFDYNFSHLQDLMNQANYPYISTNLYHMYNGKPTTRFTPNGSKIFNLKNNIKVGVIGCSTPDSITTSTPRHFQDEKGNFIYTFRENDLYQVMQKEIDNIRNECDYVVCLSHLGDEDQRVNYTASKLAMNTSGIDIIIDGHTHIPVTSKKVKDKNNKEVFITQAGGKFINIGKMSVKKGEIKNELISSYDSEDSKIKEGQDFIIAEFERIFSSKVGKTDITFMHRRNNETNLGDLCAEASYHYYNQYLPSKGEVTSSDVSIVNSGGIRVDEVNPGTWSLKNCRNIHSFGNSVALIKMKGSLLRTALEFSNYKIPDYFGGLLQVCGVKYDCNKSIESDIVVDGNRNYVSGPSESHRRLSNIKIYNKSNNIYEDLDDSKDYFVSGAGYTLIECGDGFSMFKNAEKIRVEEDVVDYLVLANYIKSFKKSGDLAEISSTNSPLLDKYPNLGINYTDEKCSGRINIITN